MMKKRDSLLKQSLRSGLLVDRQKFTHARNKVTQLLRRTKANFFMNAIEGAKGNGRKDWQLLNKLLDKENKEVSTTLALKICNILVNDSAVLAQTFNQYFLDSVNDITKLFAPSNVLPRPIISDHPIFNVKQISEHEVKKIISALKCSNARMYLTWTPTSSKHTLTH